MGSEGGGGDAGGRFSGQNIIENAFSWECADVDYSGLSRM